MVYITSDIHGNGDIKKLNSKNFPEQKNMTKKDILIIDGDFGLVDKSIKLEKHYLEWLNTRNYTTLFLDGNHEDFNVLNNYPVVSLFRGKAHQLMDSVFHLMRGEIYEIEGNTFFVMGGAESHDNCKLVSMDEFKRNHKKYTIISDNYEYVKVIGRDWFPEEMPSSEEYQNGLNNLKRYNNQVDYILSHCASARIEKILNRPSPRKTNGTHICDYFDEIEKNIKYKKWYFGHYHLDKQIDDKHECLFETVKRIL